MRVLMTADTVGGVWTYAVELARALTDRDCTIALVALGSPLRDDQRAAVENLPHVTTYELPGRLEWMNEPWHYVEASCRELRRIADDFAPDLIHANSYCHAAMEWEIPVLLVAHSCVVSWFAEVRGEEPGPEWNRYRRTVREALDAADLVVAPTAAMLLRLEQGYGPVRSTKVIPNGIGVSRDEAFDEATYSASKERAVFAAGRMWDEAKNLVAVARAADRIDAPLYCSVDPDVYRPLDRQPIYDLGYLGTYSVDRQPTLERSLIEPARSWPDGRFVVAGPQYPQDVDWPANV